MTNIWDIYQFMLFVVDKDRNGFVTPGDVSKALEAGQMRTYEKYWQLGAGINKASAEALMPFAGIANLTSAANGMLTLPADYGNLRVIESEYATYRKMAPAQVREALKSQLRPIEDFPFYVAEDGSYRLYPNRQTVVEFHYYKVAPSPLIAFTVPNQDPVYDPGNSVQLTFSPRYWMEVIHASMPYIGVRLSNPDLYALSNLYNATTTPTTEQ